ncbi:MAG: 23S rRNA (guanosine(2251)-2'-O)-methyltransferase RlmB, partial [Psychroserpens sp.]|nr:23S rRNA (guanosine(2251)-2'-O)-methyltransferase RlmB [Psychroserpens sp.]
MQKETTIFGIRAVIEAIKSGESIDKVFLQKGLRGELFTELEGLLRSERLNASYVPVEKLNRLTKKNHQGAIAQIAPIAFHNLEELVLKVFESGKTPLFLLLDQLSDVRNFGAIIRTAECTGVSGII